MEKENMKQEKESMEQEKEKQKQLCTSTLSKLDIILTMIQTINDIDKRKCEGRNFPQSFISIRDKLECCLLELNRQIDEEVETSNSHSSPPVEERNRLLETEREALEEKIGELEQELYIESQYFKVEKLEDEVYIGGHLYKKIEPDEEGDKVYIGGHLYKKIELDEEGDVYHFWGSDAVLKHCQTR